MSKDPDIGLVLTLLMSWDPVPHLLYLETKKKQTKKKQQGHLPAVFLQHSLMHLCLVPLLPFETLERE